MRIYELGVILKPDLPEQTAQEALDHIRTVVESGGGSVDKVDDWGKRPLAYRVRGFWTGHYVFIRYSTAADDGLNKELVRRLRVAEDVIKFLNVRIDEDLRKLAKAKARRAKRSASAALRRSRPGSGRARPKQPANWRIAMAESQETKPARPAGPAGPRFGGRGPRRQGRRYYRRRKVDYFSVNRIDYIDYKDVDTLKQFVGDRARSIPAATQG